MHKYSVGLDQKAGSSRPSLTCNLLLPSSRPRCEGSCSLCKCHCAAFELNTNRAIKDRSGGSIIQLT